MSRITRSYASEIARASPLSPSATRSQAHRCSSMPRLMYWPTVGSSSITRMRIYDSVVRRRSEAVLADLAVERLDRDAEQRRGASAMPLGLLQHRFDVTALE